MFIVFVCSNVMQSWEPRAEVSVGSGQAARRLGDNFEVARRFLQEARMFSPFRRRQRPNEINPGAPFRNFC